MSEELALVVAGLAPVLLKLDAMIVDCRKFGRTTLARDLRGIRDAVESVVPRAEACCAAMSREAAGEEEEGE